MSFYLQLKAQNKWEINISKKKKIKTKNISKKEDFNNYSSAQVLA